MHETLTRSNHSSTKRDFKIRRRREQQQRRLTIEFAIFKSPTRLFQLTYLFKCKRTLLELNSWEPYSSSEREGKFPPSWLTSSIKRNIGQISSRSRAVTEKECTKKRDARARLLFFLPSPLSDLKVVPNVRCVWTMCFCPDALLFLAQHEKLYANADPYFSNQQIFSSHCGRKLNKELTQQRQRRLQKRTGTVALRQNLSCLFYLVQFIKCWQFFREFLTTVSRIRKRKRKSLPYVHVVVVL